VKDTGQRQWMAARCPLWSVRDWFICAAWGAAV